MINDLDIVQWAYLLDPAFQLVNSAGKPLTDGWIEVYIHGTRNKYYCASDFDGTLHPFKIPLDSLGSNIVLASPDYAYDIYIYNKFGSLVMSRYNVVAGKGGGGSGGIPSSTEAQHWLGQYGATQALIGNETGQTLALPSRPDYQGDFVDHIDYGYINGDETNQYPKYMYLKPGLYLVNCVIRFQQQSGTEVNRLDETLVYTGNGNANEDIAWQLDETGPLTTTDRHCLKLTFIRKVLDEGETSPVDCNNILYFAPAPSVNWNDAYIQTLQIVKLNSAVQGGGVQQLLKPGEGISIDEENVISVTGMQPASGMDQYVTVINFNDYITEVTEVINNVTGDIINIQNEIDAVSAAVSSIVPEYQEGYGIIIEDNTISVDPSIIPSGCVSQEELAQVTGDIVNQIENVTGDITEITNIINNVTGDVTNLTEVVNNVTGDVQNLTTIVENVTGDINNLETIVNNVTGDINVLETNISNVSGDVTNLTEIVNGVTGDISQIETDIQTVSAAIDSVSAQIPESEEVEFEELDLSQFASASAVEELETVVDGITGDIEQIESDIQYVSSYVSGQTFEQVQSDWAQTATGEPDYIKNKPEETPVVAGEGISIEASGDMIVISTVGLASSGDVANLEAQIQTVSSAIPTDVVTHDELAAVTGDYATNTDLQIVSAAVDSVSASIPESEEVEFEELDVSQFATNSQITAIESEIQTVSSAIPTDFVTHDELASVTGDYATNADLQIVSAAIPTDVVTHDELAGVTGDYATNSDLQTVSAAVDSVSAQIPESEEIEFEELDLSQFVTQSAVTAIESEIQTVSSAIPTDVVTHDELASVTGDYATNADLQIVSAAVDSVSASIPESEEVEFEELDLSSYASQSQVTALEADIQAVSAGIPAAQVQSDWTETATGDPSFIKNKPEIMDVEIKQITQGQGINITETENAIVISALAPTGDWATNEDLQIVSAAIPTDVVTHNELATVSAAVDNVSAAIPTDVVTHDELAAVSATIPEAQIQSDWAQTATGQVDYIKNKPNEVEIIAGQNIYLTDTAQGLMISASGLAVSGDYASNADLQTVSAAVDAVSTAIPDVSDFVTHNELDAVSSAIPDVSNLATEADLQTVSGAVSAAVDAVSAAVDAVSAAVSGGGGGGAVTGDYVTKAEYDVLFNIVYSLHGKTVNVIQSAGGTVEANPVTGFPGTVVTLSNTPDTNWAFVQYNISGATLSGSTFTIGESNVTVSGTFVDTQSHTKYRLRITTNNNGQYSENSANIYNFKVNGSAVTNNGNAPKITSATWTYYAYAGDEVRNWSSSDINAFIGTSNNGNEQYGKEANIIIETNDPITSFSFQTGYGNVGNFNSGRVIQLYDADDGTLLWTSGSLGGLGNNQTYTYNVS